MSSLLPTHSVLQSLATLSILRYRGCRGGQYKERRIYSVGDGPRRQAPIAVPPRLNYSYHIPLNELNHPSIPRSVHNQSIPRLYVLNAASLAKPHAIEQLTAELNCLDIDIAVISMYVCI